MKTDFSFRTWIEDQSAGSSGPPKPPTPAEKAASIQVAGKVGATLQKGGSTTAALDQAKKAAAQVSMQAAAAGNQDAAKAAFNAIPQDAEDMDKTGAAPKMMKKKMKKK